MKFKQCLKRVLGHPAIVLIGGTWKTGKTDFALFLSQIMLKMGLVSQVASNIDTNGHYPMISDLVTIKQWLHETNRRKLYIFDEANKHIPSRRSMSNKSVGVVSLLPELSKGRARVLFLGQELGSLDGQTQNPSWLRAIFIKRNLKTVQLVSTLIDKVHTFRNIPKTTISFDPYAIAPFTERPTTKLLFKDEDLRKLWAWVNGGTWKTLFEHPNECNRFVRRHVKRLLISHSQIHIDSREGIPAV